MKALAVLCLGIVTSLNAATVAVIDSGVDYTHDQLKHNMWNSLSKSYGWNFAENNSKVFDPYLIYSFSPDVKKYSDIQSKSYLFAASDEEKEWAKEKAKDKDFIQEVNRFGNYVHGTHVAGIAMKGTDHKIMAIKLLPTPAKAKQSDLKSNLSKSPEKDLDTLLIQVALTNATKMAEIGNYVNSMGAHVANGSFGTSIYMAAELAYKAFKIVYKRDPSDDELIMTAVKFMEMTIILGKKFVEVAPNTLFVFAAGNDGLSNDQIGASPANI
ncbi:MAG: S8 family serine peptidase, partial [Bacteriovoracia bacterium]